MVIQKKKLFTWREKLSSLNIDTCDFFKGIYHYDKFIVDVELDYYRKSERGMEIIGENQKLIEVDFVNKILRIEDKLIEKPDLFNFNECYIEEIKEFIEIKEQKNITSLEEGTQIFELL